MYELEKEKIILFAIEQLFSYLKSGEYDSQIIEMIDELEIVMLNRTKKIKRMIDSLLLSNSDVIREIVESTLSNYSDYGTRYDVDIDRYEQHKYNFVEIFQVLRDFIRNHTVEETNDVAYSLHNYPQYLLGESKYNGDNLWKSIQGKYISKYGKYFLRNTAPKYTWEL